MEISGNPAYTIIKLVSNHANEEGAANVPTTPTNDPKDLVKDLQKFGESFEDARKGVFDALASSLETICQRGDEKAVKSAEKSIETMIQNISDFPDNELKTSVGKTKFETLIKAQTTLAQSSLDNIESKITNKSQRQLQKNIQSLDGHAKTVKKQLAGLQKIKKAPRKTGDDRPIAIDFQKVFRVTRAPHLERHYQSLKKGVAHLKESLETILKQGDTKAIAFANSVYDGLELPPSDQRESLEALKKANAALDELVSTITLEQEIDAVLNMKVPTWEEQQEMGDIEPEPQRAEAEPVTLESLREQLSELNGPENMGARLTLLNEAYSGSDDAAFKAEVKNLIENELPGKNLNKSFEPAFEPTPTPSKTPPTIAPAMENAAKQSNAAERFGITPDEGPATENPDNRTGPTNK